MSNELWYLVLGVGIGMVLATLLMLLTLFYNERQARIKRGWDD